MSATTATKSEVLSVFRGMLREVSKQYTRRNNNKLWHNEVVTKFRAGAAERDPSVVATNVGHAKNVYAFMRSNRSHREMVERYWPISGLTEEEKLTRTANTVGLSLPKMFGAGETWADSGAAGGEKAAVEPELAPEVKEALDIVKNAPS
ncbi:uncharacterized protein EV422DRAFT_542855 [Fimicolochytrium jonesii]|uniref:uncharacterized protein n=1 Tax=Fimicolochytrium jonesii TaxID=1396493 RepID=UPI0022FED33D|nr:uncharacterized protein EV422DRAFT_542855 [Fimicolochytrium jonesii]KAI8817200.1 hypothetical protein EV422DRAFT_542855 [Fimicolochytrium jonesii]